MRSDSRHYAFLLFAIALIFLVLVTCLMTGPSSVPTDPESVRQTPQECADNYRAMPENIKTQWTNSEEYINECVQ